MNPSSTPPVYGPKHEDLDDNSLVSQSSTSDDTFYRNTWDDDYVFSSLTWDDNFSTRHDDILTDPAYCHIPGNIFSIIPVMMILQQSLHQVLTIGFHQV
ncbi:MAG: hypothetical protein LM579_04715 [Thermodesulfobacterium sp.]|nr:hypothetical protein [Thermodesulfobacterium sp.]